MSGHLTLPILALLLWATFMSIPLRRQAGEERRGSSRFIWWVLTINFVAVPLLLGILIAIFPFSGPLAFAASMVLLAPCIDYVVTFCGLAGGDSHALLRITPLLLGAQAVGVPFYLWLFHLLGLWEMHIPSQALKEVAPSVLAALGTILIPLALAWVAQQLSARNLPARSWSELAQAVMVPAMMLVLFCTVAAHSAVVWDASEQLLWLVGLYAIFATVMSLGLWTATRGRGSVKMPAGERIALVFSGVTRNALVILPVILALSEITGQTLLPVAVMTQTLVELVVMVTMVAAFRKAGCKPYMLK